MSWLAATKVLPALQQGSPPDYRDEFVAERKPPPVAWDLFWNEQPIGMTVSQAFLQEGEPSELRSIVQFEQLEIRAILREILGALSFLTNSIFGEGSDARLDMTIATRLRLDWEGELQGFETAIKAGEAFDLFLRGQRTDEDRLRVSAYYGESVDDSVESPLAREFNLPTKSRYSDAFSPRTRMQGLWVGQKWTTPVVNPLSTSDSVRLVESFVEKTETIIWQEQPIDTFLVVYRYDSGSGSASRAPVGKAWVTADGTVVRQELPIGSARVRFERTNDARAMELAAVLATPGFERHLNRRVKPAGEP